MNISDVPSSGFIDPSIYIDLLHFKENEIERLAHNNELDECLACGKCKDSSGTFYIPIADIIIDSPCGSFDMCMTPRGVSEYWNVSEHDVNTYSNQPGVGLYDDICNKTDIHVLWDSDECTRFIVDNFSDDGETFDGDKVLRHLMMQISDVFIDHTPPCGV